MRKISIPICVMLFLIISVCFGQSLPEYHNKGMEYAMQGRFNEAIEMFKKAIAIYPHATYRLQIQILKDAIAQKIKEETAIYIFKGYNYSQNNMIEEAIAEFNKAIASNPDYSNSYIARGIFYNGEGQYDKSISDYNKVIEKEPRNAVAYDNRGASYMRRRQFEEAISDFTKVIEISPEFTEAYEGRAGCYYNMGADYEMAGRIEEAIEAYKNFIQDAQYVPKLAPFIGEVKKKLTELAPR